MGAAWRWWLHRRARGTDSMLLAWGGWTWHCLALALRSEITADMPFLTAAIQGNCCTNVLAPQGQPGKRDDTGCGWQGGDGGTASPHQLGREEIPADGYPRVPQALPWRPPSAGDAGGSVFSMAAGARPPPPRCSREPVAATCDMCQRVNDCSIQGESQNIQGQTLPRQRRHEY